MRETVLAERFPHLGRSEFRITSPDDSRYNCIAWAMGSSDRNWLPDPFYPAVYPWPKGAPREDTLQGWTAAFESVGYACCIHSAVEDGYEKVAIYALRSGSPRHVARQLPSGRWTSKLGPREDIEHELMALTGDLYGDVAQVLKRRQTFSG